jgi:predicted DNA-binding transcriptional regulator YafY
MQRLRNGGAELCLTLGHLEEVERWILSWGNHAEVLAPDGLKERIAKTASSLAATYRNARC